MENSLEQLLQDYKDYGLPLPPKDAPLVRHSHGGGGKVNGVVQPITYSLAFMTKPASDTNGPELLRGWYPWDGYLRTVFPLDPNRATPEQIQSWVEDLQNSTGGALHFAIQCKSRGFDRLAQALYEKGCLERDVGRPKTWLRREAWNCWSFRLQLIETDWPSA